MLNETTENFLKVMAEFEWPEPVHVSYRLYYNDDGSPKCYTMEDLPGKYIEVDREIYIGHFWNVCVENNKLKILPITKRVNKLSLCTDQGTTCHTQDICVIVDKLHNHKKWTMTEYEIN